MQSSPRVPLMAGVPRRPEKRILGKSHPWFLVILRTVCTVPNSLALVYVLRWLHRKRPGDRGSLPLEEPAGVISAHTRAQFPSAWHFSPIMQPVAPCGPPLVPVDSSGQCLTCWSR